MTTIKSYAIALLLSAGFTAVSCGSKQESTQEEKTTVNIKPDDTEISGPMEGCFTVVDREYSAKLDEFIGGEVAIELKRTDESLPFSSEGRDIFSFSSFSTGPYVQVGFGIEILDENGNIVGKTSANGSGLGGSYDPDECVELVKLKPGQTGSIRFRVTRDEAADAVSFRITSAYEYGGSESDEMPEVAGIYSDDTDNDDVAQVVTSSDSDEKSSSASDTDWDSLLDSYEKFVNKYIPFCNKVKSGAITASDPEYLEMMQESAGFIRKMHGASPSSMTASQWARYSKLSAKVAAVAGSM